MLSKGILILFFSPIRLSGRKTIAKGRRINKLACIIEEKK